MSEEIKLIAYRCRNCGRVHYPRCERCLTCKKREFDEIRPQGKATLLTFTAVYSLPVGFEDQQMLCLGVVEFENQVRALGQISAAPSALKEGMALTASWGAIRRREGQTLYGLILAP
ncbi:MAG: OB-fold domain-containing protein [Anaerolineales bacterium]|nr:OB-fold domain-containing protein [Anaerolineales bacterium]